MKTSIAREHHRRMAALPGKRAASESPPTLAKEYMLVTTAIGYDGSMHG